MCADCSRMRTYPLVDDEGNASEEEVQGEVTDFDDTQPMTHVRPATVELALDLEVELAVDAIAPVVTKED